MGYIKDGGPAFPSTTHGHKGISLRQYAAIMLRVPDSGTAFLDEMIISSLRADRPGLSLPALSLPVVDSERISWSGGQCPVDENVIVSVRIRNGTVTPDFAASQLRWTHTGGPDDIIAYREVAS